MQKASRHRVQSKSSFLPQRHRDTEKNSFSFPFNLRLAAEAPQRLEATVEKISSLCLCASVANHSFRGFRMDAAPTHCRHMVSGTISLP